MAIPIISVDPNTGQPIVALDISPTVATSALVGDAGVAMAKALIDNVADVKANYANVLRWGLVGDRVTPNDSQLDDLLFYLKTLVIRPAIYFPAGFYLFNSQVNFDLPGIKIVGDGMGASFLVGDNGVLCNYPQPTLHDIGITTESATSTGTGLELRNCWQATLLNVLVHDFAKQVHVSLTDEGEGLIPGNTPGGPYPVQQFTRHGTWPSLDEFVRDGLTTTEHWGSRVTLVRLANLHLIGKTTGDIGVHLDNPLADPASDHDDFDSLSGSSGQGVFYTGISIEGGHFGCNGTNLHVGGGVHGVKVSDAYFDCNQEGVRLDYGAQGVTLNDVNLDFGGQYAVTHAPSTVYIANDLRRIGERSYICTTGGTSAANINYNGVPNSEFVGATETIKLAPVAGSNDAGSQLTQAQLYGMKISSIDVQVFVEGVSIIDGKRWLNIATYLPVATGSSETANFWFNNDSRAQLFMPAVSGDELWISMQVQHRDPKITIQPAMIARVRAANSSGSFTEQSTGIVVTDLTDFKLGKPVVVNDTMTLAVGTSASVTPYISVTYSAAQFGWFPFRVAVPQINAGASLGAYVRTYGRRRGRNQDGPSGTGTGITDGTVIWDYAGTPIAAVIAPRQCWEVSPSDTAEEIRIKGVTGTNQSLPGTNPLPHYFVVIPNPANSNSHPTTVAD